MRSTFLICLSLFLYAIPDSLAASGVIYRNPRVYNVDYSFELLPDPNKIDRAKDLKLWLPIPREWDSQKAVKIISVEPEPHARYIDPEHGNPIFFWDFGKEPEQTCHRVKIKYRLESYEVHAEVDPEQIGPYDKTSKEYGLYTRSTHSISITPKVKELAQEAVGDEKNPYLQAKRIFEFVRKKMRFTRNVRWQRGSGVKCLLNSTVIDEETGEEYYEGACGQYRVFFVALCRAERIPARGVYGYLGWGPWIKEEDLKLREHPMKLSPDGLAGARMYGALGAHGWAEFYLPNYGWIPVDPTWGEFGHLGNKKVIAGKGRDVKIGPHAPQKKSEGYGCQWIPLYNGRADGMNLGAWNIAKVRTARVKILHHSDPFPASGLNEYAEKFYPVADAERKLRDWRNSILSWTNHVTRGRPEKNAALAKAYQDAPSTRYSREAFVCHMLRKVVGGEAFFEIVNTYENLRVNSGGPVSTARFQKIAEEISGRQLGWFFKQWVGPTELPHLKLDGVTVSKREEGWYIHGHLRQLPDSIFRLPVELTLVSREGTQYRKKVWLEKKNIGFDFTSSDRPTNILVDPDNEILKIQRMPPRAWGFWDVYPKTLYIVIYGTLAEAEANKTAAERFNAHWLGLGDKITKADIDVNEADLKSKCVILFGRPETNKITQQFKDIFPIRFDGNEFPWQGITYNQSTQGVAQIVENPNDPQSLLIMYAGLSGEAIQKSCDLYLHDFCRYLYAANASYVIFDRDKQLVSGDWEGFDSALVWNFE